MNGRIFRNLYYLLLILAVAPWGLNPAQAGPGGGTYYANSPAGGSSGAALRKFVDSLPGVGPANKNNLGNYIPIATPIAGKPGVPADGDYYEIDLVEYSQKLHSDLPKKTRLRGYRDASPAFANLSTQYLGPLIIAKRDRPVRLKLNNKLPTGAAGNLFIPVDTTLMGAGMGPLTAAGAPCDPAAPAANCASYSENRATIHLHGGNSPWISDGTPHQWTAPAGEVTPYKKGVGARDVPDMPPSGDGSLTFFWTNQQSNRLMFYHDHTLGITRLNVYAGEAAGYLLTDAVEEGLINNGTLPNICPGGPTAACEYRYGIPLIIQDKTFVPQNIAVQDSKWTNPSWGVYGDLWMPHVYEPNQDPTSPAGANPFGRWDYGPWFWPPIGVAADKATLPDPSTTPEAFHDTFLINGAAYPYLTVEPKPYRFRILNAANDRALNLSLFYADPTDPSGKEVKMVPAGPNPGFPAGPFPDLPVWPTDGRAGGVPDPATIGPKMIQIGSESGFLPNAVIHPNQPVNYNYNRRDIVVLNVQEKNLFMGSAERADVIIDFSQVPPGSTIILYNDAPAPVPAGDPRQDYYTGGPDQTANGGAPSTLRGYGPNTRTIMQFRVAGTPSAPFNLANLQTALPVAFQATQPAPVVPQPAYPVASGGNAPTEQYAKIQDYSMTFTPIGSTIPTTIPFQPKAIQELWDPYGRMNATLGVELPFTTGRNQTTVPMGYAEPATERIVDGHIQMWKITHNGVDTHPVHFHMFDVQIINRVGWDGAIRPPDDNELGWKETVRMNPLEDIIVALRPKAQTLPAAFGTLPNSKRAIDPTMPADAMIATTDVTTNPVAGVATTVRNTPLADAAGYDYGYEYVWHCHILGHEENDFMRPVIFAVSTAQAPQPTGLTAYLGGSTVPGKAVYVAPYTNQFINKVVLQWSDNAPVSTPSYFLIERDSGAGFQPLTTISYLTGYPPIYTDASVAAGVTYSYRVTAQNAFLNSAPSNVATVTTSTWPAATAVTLAPSKASPHVVGTNVQFVAAGSGAILNPNPNLLTVAYQYRFLLNGVEVQAYSNNNIWTLSDTTPIGAYTVTVQVRTKSSVAFDAQTTINYQVIATPIPPTTLAGPIPGVYTAAPVVVTLTATNSASAPVGALPPTIYYTTNGTIPTTATISSFVGSGTIAVNATTTINYFAVDVNGNAEAVHSDTWFIHSATDMLSSVKINSGATSTNNTVVTLSLSAIDPVGVTSMQFSNDNITYSAEEPFLSTKLWTLTAGDGLKTVYVRFRDKTLPQPGGFLYPPVTAQITLDTVPPITAASPLPGSYPPLTVTLTPNEAATVYYTTDGTVPTTASSVYTVPILLAATTTLKYFAVDTAGNVEAPKSGLYTISIPNLTASVIVNGGATATKTTSVTLALAAATTNTGGAITGMQFSNDGTTYTPATPEAFAATKNWQITTGDGVKTVYVKFTETNLAGLITYPPVSANITLDTVAPVTSISPLPGLYSSPVSVVLTANEPATIRYTLDGSAPTATSLLYSAPIPLSATTTIRYMAIDTAGNQEVPKTGTWTIQAPNLVASVTINNGSAYTNLANVTLNLSATSSAGVSAMQFSNDGVNYTAEEPYATTRAWTLTPGDGLKTVYVKFRDGSAGGGFLYNPVSANVIFDTVAPVTTASPITGIYGTPPVAVTLTSNEPGKIYYTTNGTNPTTASTVYTGAILLATTATVKYFAVDLAGNSETVKSGTWQIDTGNLVGSITINHGALATNNSTVILTLNATDPAGVKSMQFSNDGINYTAEENYATSRTWTLSAGDALKTVYVRFRDDTLPTGVLHNPVSAQILFDTVAPVTTASPVTGVYSASAPIQITLSASEPATIYYTIDGSVPTTASPQFVNPITLAATTTINYFAVDTAGNAEAVKSGTWTIHTNSDLVASVKINNGATATSSNAVTLTLSAVDPVGVASMQFSNDGLIYSVEEPYAPTKAWTLVTGDGTKTVYVRFRDKSLNGGNLYAPVTAQIVLDTVAPVTTAGPIPGSYGSNPVPVTLTANEAATIYYTTDGTIPSTNSLVYTLPITILAATPTTINYFAVDTAGNMESVKSGSWTFHVPDMVASVLINSGLPATKNANVTLALSAVDRVTGNADKMQFSNDGISYSAEEPYATTKSWTLTAGDGNKTVYARFRESASGGGTLYDPVTAHIVLDTVLPVTTPTPLPGIYSSALPVALSVNEPAVIHYTLDNSTPTALSPIYSAPFAISATTTIKYMAIDTAGNQETPKTGTWTIQAPNLVANANVNNGATHTNQTVVTLNLSATSATGVSAMQFSNDGTNYTAEEPYATTKAWTLTSGDGLKTVYVKFRDGSAGGGFLYNPVTAQITLDTVAPITTAGPITGVYSTVPVPVTLASNEPGTIYYTTDGTIPTTASTAYTGAILLASTSTVNYFAVDLAGNSEPVKTGTWTIHASDLVASVTINNGTLATNNSVATLTLSAIDPAGIGKMQFSNDGINYTVEENYAASKTWTLLPGDGLKTVYVRFRDNSLPSGNLYAPVTAQILFDTVAPVTTASPVTGVYSSAAPVPVTLSASEPATIYYTIDGSVPTTASPQFVNTITLAATTTINYFAVDTAGNAEAVKSSTWTIHTSADLVASVKINNAAAATNSTVATLTLNAVDPVGVASMQFSNDGLVYTVEEPYAPTKAWTLVPGDGTKTVYVRFRDKSLNGGNLYAPVTAQIVMDTVAPVTTAGPLPGSYGSNPVPVTLTTNEPATIYYTSDGTIPSINSSVYAAPITVPTATPTTIKYFAIDTPATLSPSSPVPGHSTLRTWWPVF